MPVRQAGGCVGGRRSGWRPRCVGGGVRCGRCGAVGAVGSGCGGLAGSGGAVAGVCGGDPGLALVDVGSFVGGRVRCLSIVRWCWVVGVRGCWGLGCVGCWGSLVGVCGRGCRPVVSGGGVVFVFPGQGSQWVGMAVELLDASPVFAERMGRVVRRWRAFVDWSLEDVLRGVVGAPGLDRVDVVQPVLFAVMVSLAGLWGACGVRPVAVVGHSQGEIAAACVAGGLSLEDAARVVALRSRALVGLAGRGGMVSVAAWVRARLRGWLERWDGRVGVAAVNGPGSVVVSGDAGRLRGCWGS